MLAVSIDGFVQYYLDGTLVYTSDVEVSFPLAAVASLYAAEGSVTAPVWLGKEAWCRGVVCRPSNCRDAGTCQMGLCTVVVSADGAECNDQNASTTNDACLSGVCIGDDSCADITCTESDSCHADSRCNFGRCYAGDVFDDATSCDDGDDGTSRDACDDGVCIGLPVTSTPTGSPTPRPTSAPSVSPHSTGPTPAPTDDTTPEPTTDRVTCDSITCDEPDQCHQPMVCNNGQCFVGARKEEGTACNDDNDQTSNDRCISGVCAGTDYCQDVDCAAPNECQLDGQCLEGECQPVFRSNGIPCNDNDAETNDDRCYAGECVGINGCDGVSCRALSDCHTPGECIRGVCSNPIANRGTPCNDGESTTLNDTCSTDGTCIGIDPCADVNCPATQCHGEGSCAMGECQLGDPFAENTDCDDGDAETADDVCNADGECAGVSLCLDITCEQQACHTTATCSMGECFVGEQLDDFTECDDGNYGTDNDVCIDGACTGRRNLCYGVTCGVRACHTDGQCNLDTGSCGYSAATDGTSCDDGNDRTDNDMCIDEVCAGDDLCAGVVCPAAAACQLPDASHDGACFRGICQYTEEEDETPCDDGDDATDDDACLEGACAGTDYCADVQCEEPTDSCVEIGICASGVCGDAAVLANGTSCDDDDARTDFDICTAGVCAGVDLCDGVICEQASPCGETSCYRGNCTTAYFDDGTDCDDAVVNIVNTTCEDRACVGIDTCADVTCQPTSRCHNAGECILGECAESTFKARNAPCTIDEESGSGSGDDAGGDNTTNVCHEGECLVVEWCELIACPAADQCHEGVECSFGRCPRRPILVNAQCDDGDEATIDDSCGTSGVCAGIPNLCVDVECNAETDCTHQGVCDPYTGACNYEDKAAGTTCDDGDESTDNDGCDAGECAGEDLCLTRSSPCLEEAVCSIGGGCYRGECIDLVGEDDGTVCDDGNRQTVGDQCINAECIGTDLCDGVECGLATDCLEAGVCSMGQCVQQVQEEDHTVCDDNDIFTDLDTCQNGACVGGNTCAPRECQASTNPCTVAVCRSEACTEINRPDGYYCDDGDSVTDLDQCNAGQCVGVNQYEAVTCTPMDQCHTAGTCTRGQCSNPLKNNGTLCDDEDVGTELDYCVAGACNGFNPCTGVVCASETQCLQAAVCRLGDCQDAVPKTNGTRCDDDAVDTYADFCRAGRCAGRLPCVEGSGCVAFSEQLKLSENVNYGLTRMDSEDGWDSGAISTIGIVPGSGVFGGVQFAPAQHNKNVFVGLGRYETEPGYHSIEYGLYLTLTGNVYIYESGRWIAALGTYRAGNHIKIYLDEDNQIVYENDGQTRVSPTTLSSSDPLHVEVTVFDSGASVDQFEFLTRQDIFCAGVTCQETPICHVPIICVLGECTGVIESPIGTACDDGNATNDNDVCEAGSVCIGEDLCADVTCEDDLRCETPVTCSHGTCSECIDVCADVTCSAEEYTCAGPDICSRGSCAPGLAAANGTLCDDGDAETGFDHCNGAGACVGLVLCDDVECPEANNCQVSMTCAEGRCIAVDLPLGFTCDDGNANTLEDSCDGVGRCVGRDYCEDRNITCARPDSCQLQTSCFQGSCLPHPDREDSSRCDDGQDGTINDRCLGGICAGVNLCDDTECPRPGQCVDSFSCFNGTCVPEPTSRGTGCDDGIEGTQLDECDGAGQCLGYFLQETPECVAEIRCLNEICVTTLNSEGDACTDGDDATEDDACDGQGNCVGRDYCEENSVVCEDPDQCHLATRCYHGACLAHPNKADNTACDGSVCTCSSRPARNSGTDATAYPFLSNARAHLCM